MIAAAASAEIRRGLRPLLLDAIAPLACYYILRNCGIADLPALLAAGAIAATRALVSLVSTRRLGFVPILVCVMFVLTGGLAFVVHDPRVILLKPSIVSAAFALYVLTLSVRRRALGSLLERLIARRSAERAAQWRQAWDTQPPLRRTVCRVCFVAGWLMLAEAAARTAIVWYFPVGQSLILAHGPALILVAALVLLIRLVLKPAVVAAMAEQSISQPDWPESIVRRR